MKKNIAARKRACRACSAERREQLRGALVLWKSATRTAASPTGTPRNAPSLTLVDGVKGDDARASEAKRDSAAATPGDDAVEALLKPLKELARDGRRTHCEARQHDEAVYLLAAAAIRRRVRRVDERRPAPHQITVFTRHLPVLGQRRGRRGTDGTGARRGRRRRHEGRPVAADAASCVGDEVGTACYDATTVLDPSDGATEAPPPLPRAPPGSCCA